MFFLINLTTKCKTNLRDYLRNNSEEIHLRSYLQDMLVNIIRKKEISNRMFVICIINTAIITINTIKTITMPIISYFI